MHQDMNGFMWIGTYDGLNRYDGYEFKVYRNRLGDATSLISNNVYCVSGDADNNLWIGTSSGGCVLDQVTDVFKPLEFLAGNKQQAIIGNVHQIKSFGSYGMLVGTQQSGLIMYSNKSFLGKQVPLIKSGKPVYNYDVLAVQPVPGKNYGWVFVRNLGLCTFNIATGNLTIACASKLKANCMITDSAGKLWIGADEGLFCYDTATRAISQNFLPKLNVVNLLSDGPGLMIASDGGGLFVLQQGAKQAVPYSNINKETVVKSNAVYCLYKDRAANKWIGTLRGGISTIGATPTYFSTIKYKGTDPNNLTENFILSFCEDEKNNVWIGTDGAGLRYWNRRNNSYSHYSKAEGSKYRLTSNFVTGLVRDAQNRIWVSTWAGGVNRIDPATGRIEYFNCENPVTGQTERNIWLVYKDSHNDIWASATNEGALYRFNIVENRFELFDAKINNLQCLTETRDGKLWGGNYTSLYSIDTDKHKHEIYEIGYPVRAVLEDSKHRLWVGTQEGGLLLFDRKTKKYKRFSTTDGLPGNTILRLIEDKNGDLWMSTYNGLSRFDADTNLFMNFSANDGIQSNQFSFNAGLKLSTGEILFGGIRGFNSFRPELIKDTKPVSNILLSGLSINNNPVEKKTEFVTEMHKGQIQGIRLPFDQTTLSIDFVEPDFKNSDKVTYAYYLEGWDEHWNYVNHSRRANYTRLLEGDYTFKVKTKNINGTWNKPTALLHIMVLPPWYRSWWAYMLYAALAAGAVYSYIRYNKNREQMRYKVKLAQMESIKEKELAEKQIEMFTYISHEFRTPLSLIINPLQRAIKKPDSNPDLPNDLAVAHRNARRLLSLVDQLLLFRKAKSDADVLKISAININQLCNEVYQCFVSQAKDRKITYNFEMPEQDIEIIGDYEKIEISLFNLMSNAFKYTPPGGTIGLLLSQTDKEIEIAISDTGKGIPEGELQAIFEKFRQASAHVSVGTGFGIGLYIVKYFTEKHKGRVSCTSEPGKGSRFVLNFLKGYDHFEDIQISEATPKMSELVEELLADNMDEVTVAETGPDEELNKKILTDKRSILIIDDNPDIRSYLIRMFSETYVVYSAENGEDGLKLTKQHMPDLVVSDITMEVMDGLELCRKIKGSDELSHIPVILLTASQNTETHLQGINDGADDYIMKPFDDNILLARVDALMRSRSNLRKYFLDSITLKENTQKVPAEYQDFLKKCITIIEAGFDDPDFSIKSFAVQMGMSHRTLYTKIKIISGQTLNAFIRSVKLRRAALLMLTENINIAQASAQVGFEDPKYFRQQFVKLFGMTPSEYIKKYKGSFNSDLNIIK